MPLRRDSPARCPACDDELGAMLLGAITAALAAPTPALTVWLLVHGVGATLEQFAKHRHWVFPTIDPEPPSTSESGQQQAWRKYLAGI